MRITKRILVLGALLFLAACNVPTFDHTLPAPPAVDTSFSGNPT